MRRSAIVGSFLLAACSFDPTGIDPGGDRGDDGPPADAADDDGAPIDASPIDAPPIDAPLIDARIDAPVIDAPPPCPIGYTAGYRYISTHSTWLAAEQDCENDQPGRTHLVVINDATEGNALSSALSPNPLVEQALWIGVVRDPNPAAGDPEPWAWRAVTGGAAPYTPWSAGQPDNVGGGQYVIRVDKTTGQFFDRPVSDATLPALCECDGRPPVNADYDPLTP